MNNQHILQVSELTKKVRFILESELNTVWLCGEISNFIAANSGHWYLSLKDSKSQVRCAMFKGNNQRVRISPKNGQQVLVRARVSLYEPRGDFQLIIEQMDDAGEGLLRQQFEALKNKLNAEGLFQQFTKKPLPKHVNTVGVVTSPTGAAIKDILSVLKRRNPHIEVIIYPCLVQGELATNDIKIAIEKANARQECDVLIVGRGGGSLEDLWSFNEEIVIRAIYNSTIPVVSAVGHEIDTTLSDYAADLRAPTPSAAAELVSQDQSETRDKISSLTTRLFLTCKNKLAHARNNFVNANNHLARFHPVQQMQLQSQKCDELTLRLNTAMTSLHRHLSEKPNKLAIQLSHCSPTNKVSQFTNHIQQLEERLVSATHNKYQNKANHFGHLVEQLNIVSPLATIARGYSVSRKENGDIIKSIKHVSAGDDINIQVEDGLISANVKAVKTK